MILCGYNPDHITISRKLSAHTTTTCDHRHHFATPHSSTPSPPPSSTPPHPYHRLHQSTSHHITTSSSSPPPSPHHYRHFNTLSLVVLAVLCTLLATPTTAQQQQACTNNAGCFPPVGNLALGRTIQVNSTCAQNELFCLLLASQCAQCSPNDLHSAASLNDDDNSTFWVSEIGPEVGEVELRLDFENPVRFQDMTLVWQSIRPVAMTLERSCDNGLTWSVYRYYALDCQLSFMMEDTYVVNLMQPFNGTTPICTSNQIELFSFDFTDAVVS